MRTILKVVVAGLVAGALVLTGLALNNASRTVAAETEGPQLACTFYYALKESNPEGRKKLVEACYKLLSKHPGEVYFVVGTRTEDFIGPAVDQDFDVAMHIVFKNRAACLTWWDSRRRLQFSDDHKLSLKNARVFDSYLAPAPASGAKTGL